MQSSKNKCEIVDRVEGKEKRVIKDNTQIAKKEEIVTPKKKLEVAKVEEPKQEDFKPKNKDKDNEAPIIEIAEAITVNDSNYKFEGKVSDQSKNIFVEVDGRLVDVKNGVFKVVGYSPVDKNIKIEAIDGFGNRSKPKIVKLTIDIKETEVVQKLEPLNPSNLNTKVSNNKVALIFGIENYSDSPKAQFANLDAKYFYDYARKAFGINKQNIKILVDQDATFIETNKVITKWLRSKIVEGESELIIFFAGHGLASPNGKELFLLSHDSDPDLLDITALSRSKLFKSIMSFNPSSVTMFLDTCYSGVSRDEEMLLASARPIRVVADEQDGTPDNFSIFSASKLDQISSGLSQAKHGIFSYFLMKGLEGKADLNNDKQITNGELLAYMDKNVSKKAAEQGRDQNPSFTGDPDKVLISFR
ncbi:caspase family protein [Candidatus Pelagibacter sp.]|nr:caspase family protein [Candidatus Pelagibacter sp.]